MSMSQDRHNETKENEDVALSVDTSNDLAFASRCFKVVLHHRLFHLYIIQSYSCGI